MYRQDSCRVRALPHVIGRYGAEHVRRNPGRDEYIMWLACSHAIDNALRL